MNKIKNKSKTCSGHSKLGMTQNGMVTEIFIMNDVIAVCYRWNARLVSFYEINWKHEKKKKKAQAVRVLWERTGSLSHWFSESLLAAWQLHRDKKKWEWYLIFLWQEYKCFPSCHTTTKYFSFRCTSRSESASIHINLDIYYSSSVCQRPEGLRRMIVLLYVSFSWFMMRAVWLLIIL